MDSKSVMESPKRVPARAAPPRRSWHFPHFASTDRGEIRRRAAMAQSWNRLTDSFAAKPVSRLRRYGWRPGDFEPDRPLTYWPLAARPAWRAESSQAVEACSSPRLQRSALGSSPSGAHRIAPSNSPLAAGWAPLRAALSPVPVVGPVKPPQQDPVLLAGWFCPAGSARHPS